MSSNGLTWSRERPLSLEKPNYWTVFAETEEGEIKYDTDVETLTDVINLKAELSRIFDVVYAIERSRAPLFETCLETPEGDCE